MDTGFSIEDLAFQQGARAFIDANLPHGMDLWTRRGVHKWPVEFGGPGIRDRSVNGCQGYSKLGAGSHLANLQTKAELSTDGTFYTVNGQKVWTALAHIARRMFCSTRASNTGVKQDGITFLLIPMGDPSIEVKPIITLGGSHSVKEAYITDVNVGDHCPLDAPTFHNKRSALEAGLMAFEFTELRSLASVSAGGDPDPESSIMKLKHTEIQQRVFELNLEAAGIYAAAWGTPAGPDFARGATGLSPSDYPTVDGLLAAELTFDNVTVSATDKLGPLDDGHTIIEKIARRTILALAAKAIGAMQVLYQDTIAYTQQRKQFDHPLSEFKVLKYLIGKASRFVGQSAVQLHGGTGMTEKLRVARYFKRLMIIDSQYDNTDHPLEKFVA